MIKIMIFSTLGVVLINSLYPVSLFFFSVAISIGVLWEVGAYFSDFLSLLSFMVYISGITAVIGYFITFFPKKMGGSFLSPCVYSVAFMSLSSMWVVSTFSTSLLSVAVMSASMDSIFSMSFYGLVVLFLAPILFIVMVAVVMMSKPERMTLRRW
uniref:NADH dehydrogenase subunit 6 n=1 Tax=Crassostrea tulipa TaxID=2912563 RepID=A0A0K0PWG6_9BIVA|nr:NADH dehydrogenase subunit 6 [Crassostrea gasar]AKQ78439.1 NADH dehydrogenase subunit 6 [Crassostrea gasar]